MTNKTRPPTTGLREHRMAKERLNATSHQQQPYYNNDDVVDNASVRRRSKHGEQQSQKMKKGHHRTTLANCTGQDSSQSSSSHNTHTTAKTTIINKQRQSLLVLPRDGPHNDAEQDVSPGPSSPRRQRRRRSRSKGSNARGRFQLLRNSSTLRRILSSTFKDLSLGYYLSILMVISFKIFIFANTLNTVMGAKTFYMHWNTSNSM